MTGSGGVRSQPRAQVQRVRLPTVEEALQYSPMTSIVPFTSDIIPFPEAVPTSLTPIPLSHAELDDTKRTLGSLNSYVLNHCNSSVRLKEVMSDLQHDLNGDSLTKFKFKTPALVQRPSHHSSTRTTSFKSLIQPFPKLLLESTSISYRYPTPISPDIRSLTNGLEQTKAVQKGTAFTNGSGAQSQHVRAVDQDTATTLNFPVSPNTVAGQRAPPIPSVIIPSLPSSSDPNQYQKFPDVDARIIEGSAEHSRKRKRDDSHLHLLVDDISVDQRHRADTAVMKLQELMINIFEAEDQLEPDTSGIVSCQAQSYFLIGGNLEIAGQVLAPEMQSRLENTLTMVIEAGRYKDMSTEYLARLQKLCAAALTLAVGLDLSVPNNADDNDIDDWARKVETAENSLRASKTLLKMMSAETDEKQLQSAEILQDLLNNLKQILENCLIPVVETRATSGDTSIFKTRPDHLKLLMTLLQRSGRVLKLLGDLILNIDISESSVTSVEFLATRLVFVENAPSEKDSFLGIQRFEAVRRHAMDVVAKVFLRYPEQRRFIIDEILSSLEKLPVTRQNARHFKIVDGKPIQLVSALIMQLIQTSAMQITSERQQESDHEAVDHASAQSHDFSDMSSDSESPHRKPAKHAAVKPATSASRSSFNQLVFGAEKLFDGANQNANYVARYLVQRALTSTKTGDQPYRNLLDIFTEDFVGVLGSLDWPAAELLLRALLSNLISITEGEKSGAPAKNMALDLMGLMGSGITDLRNYINRASQIVETAGTPLSRVLPRLCEDCLEGNGAESDVLKLDGPCRAVMDSFQHSSHDDLQVQSARGFFLVQWARSLSIASEAAAKDLENTDNLSLMATFRAATEWLATLMQDADRVGMESNKYTNASLAEVRLCYALALLNLPLCKALRRIFSVLLASLSSAHATVRSRSLKSVMDLLEKDPSILDQFGNVLKHIVHCASDTSPLVRDSALGLIGRCMKLRPALEAEGCKTLIARTGDAATGVRKRALKLLKEVYLRNKNTDIRAAVADAMMRRIDDNEESVSEIAHQTIEEIWFTPFHDLPTDTSMPVQVREDLKQHASHIVWTVRRGADVLGVLEAVLQRILSDKGKNFASNRFISKALVSAMFDEIIDEDDAVGNHSRNDMLQTLTVFAKACPQLFEADQMTILRPYIENLATADDLVVYRSVIVIYRCVLPILPPLQQAFLKGVQDALFKSVSKLGKLELDEISKCLWIIDNVLQNTERLVRLLISVLKGIEGAKKQDLTGDPALRNRVRKYMMIAGYFGKACDLNTHRDSFREQFPAWTSGNVSSLIVDTVSSFSGSKQPLEIRESALESMCLVCQANPKNFLKPHLTAAFAEAFKERETRLELVILCGIRAFYEAEEVLSKSGSEIPIGDGVVNGAERLGKSMVLSDNDGASTSIAQQYLPHILRIALATYDDLALTATEVIASTNRQGLVHPKETGPALVALQTSPNPRISEVALLEHRNLHHKHESMLEKEYLKAVDQTFAYQRDTVKDISGVDAQKAPKLRPFYEVLKSGSIGLRKRFIGNLCARLDIDFSRVKDETKFLEHLRFVRFALENLGLIEYGRVDEILHLIGCIEKVFAKTGNIVSQNIERRLNLQMRPSGEGLPSEHRANDNVGQHSLLQLTASSMTLSILWETRTHLRRTWGLQSLRDGKMKPAAKDVSKAPVKVPSVSAEKYLDKIAEIMNSLTSEEKMIERCSAFVELHTVDKELVLGSDEEDSHLQRLETPSEDLDGDNRATPKPGDSARSKKRQGSLSARSTPSKPRKKGRPSLGGRKRTGSKGLADDEDGNWD